MLFGFEAEFAARLEFIPMVVRLKLDLVGIKLSLQQWQGFPLVERRHLVEMRYETPVALQAFAQSLAALIVGHGQGQVERVPVPADPPWEATGSIPDQILKLAQSQGLPVPTEAQWAQLAMLQRFALLKLSRPGHDHRNFAPAMRECGLTPDSSPAPPGRPMAAPAGTPR